MRLPTYDAFLEPTRRAVTSRGRGDPSEIALRAPTHDIWLDPPPRGLPFPPFLATIAILATAIYFLASMFGRMP